MPPNLKKIRCLHLSTPILPLNINSSLIIPEMGAETHCKHFVTRKKRFCRMTVREGDEYCGEHRPNTETSDTTTDGDLFRRITCPLDPKHTCYASKLKQHLKKCNAKPTATPTYIHKNINAGDTAEVNKSRQLSSVPIAVLLEVIGKVNKIHRDVIKDSIAEKLSSHPILDEELSKSEYGNSTKKHLIQTSSIVGLLQEHNLLQTDMCYVEFGAGKGKLSYWVSKTLENLGYSSSSVLLVERASHRHKYDNKLDKATANVVRVRADIADLILSKVEVVGKAKRVVGLTKHLCGDATDLALRCMVGCLNTGKDIAGVVMAFCCHHRCRWSSYAGRAFFKDVGLSDSDFDVMCGMVSWAVCGTGQSRERRQNPEINLAQNTKDAELGLSRDQKEEVGKKCKDLLNWGRKMYLQNNGFKSILCYYVNREVSLENVCVIGVKEDKVLQSYCFVLFKYVWSD